MTRLMESRTAAGLLVGAALCCAGGLPGLGGSALAAQDGERQTLARIAPPDTAAIIVADNWPGMKASMDRSGLGALWREPDVKRFIESLFESPDADEGVGRFKTWMEELDISWDDFEEPTGAVGAALIFRPDADAEAGMPDARKAHIIVMGDFGEGLEKNHTTLVTMLDDMEERGHIEIDEDEYGGATITTITILEKEEEEAEPEPDEWQWDVEEEEPFDYDKVFMAGVDGVLLLATELNAIEQAIDRIEGVEDESLADDAMYIKSLAQHPENPEAFGAIYFREDIRRMIGETFGGMLMFFVPPGTDAADLLGVKPVQSVSIGQRFDTDLAMAEQTWAMVLPEKKGLFKLVDEPVAGFEPPSFAGPDAASVTRAAIGFDEVFPLVRDMVASLPEHMQAQFGPWMDEIARQYEPIFNTLGPEVYFANTIQRPLSIESERTVVAVRVKDSVALTNALSPIMAQTGTEARDFQGNQLYDMDGQMAFGVGFGFLFIGPTPDVENAMRLASAPDGPRLAAEDRFMRAVSPLGRESIVAGYSDLRQTMEFAYWALGEQQRLWEEQMNDPDMAEHMEFMEAMKPPAWIERLPPVELLIRHLGDSVYEIGPSPDGYRGRSLLLRPNNQG